jgi:virginiamycin B lyase
VRTVKPVIRPHPYFATALLLALAACGGASGTSTFPSGIAAGADGTLWFAECGANKIARMTTDFVLTQEYPIPTPSSAPVAIAKGPDGAMWFTEVFANAIGRIDTAGRIRERALPNKAAAPIAIVAGPDGAMWFAERDAGNIGRIGLSGSIAEFKIPAFAPEPTSIALGADGASLWFTEHSAHRIGRITPSGRFTQRVLPENRRPFGIVAGPDGAMWFTEFIERASGGKGAIGRIDANGRIREYLIPTPGESYPERITAGPGNTLWFVDHDERIGRVTTRGAISLFSIPIDREAAAMPEGIALGPDGNLWYTAWCSNRIGRVTPSGTLTEVAISAGAGSFSLNCPG